MSRLASLPVYVALCVPSMHCPQAARCARFVADESAFHERIDASICASSGGCGLFIDERALGLFPQPKSAVKPPERVATWLSPIGATA